MGQLSTNQILVKGLKFPHFPTLSETRGCPSLTTLTIFSTFENQKYLYGPIIHKYESSHEPKISTFVHPLGCPCPTIFTIFSSFKTKFPILAK